MASMNSSEKTPLCPQSGRRLSRRTSSRRGEVSFKDDHVDMDGSFKAAVFGFNDGLCANTCLMIGIASASNITPSTVIASGLVGLLAGAASMGAGEWISSTLNNALEQNEIERERQHLKHHTEEEDKNLQRVLREELGFSQETVNKMFEDMHNASDEMKLRINAKLELGLDVDAERGNPLKAMVFMMGAFTLGAAVPLLPWVPLWYAGPLAAVWLSVLCSLIASIIVGLRLAQETGQPLVFTAVRQVFAAAVAIFSVWAVGYVYQALTGEEAPPV